MLYCYHTLKINIMEILTYKIKTGMGYINTPLEFLSDEEKKILDELGYKGGNRIKYLDSLGKGTFKMTQTKFDNGDFQEEFILTRVLI